jgi:hypothetical protein
MAKPRSQLAEAYDAPYLEYWAALGRFVHEFSRVEYLLQVLLKQLAGVADPIGRAIFSDTRAHVGKDAVKRILDARGELVAKARLESALTQLGIINGIRNDVVHWGAMHDGTDALLVSNANRVTANRVREFRLSPLDLEAMSIDLFGIGIHFIVAIQIDAAKSDDVLEHWREALKAPWLYRPAQQAPRRKSRRSRTEPS